MGFNPIMYALCKKSDGALPVVELSTDIFGDGSGVEVTLSEAESAALTEAAKGGMPVVVKVDLSALGTGMVVTIVTQNIAALVLVGVVDAVFELDGFQMLLNGTNRTNWTARFATATTV